MIATATGRRYCDRTNLSSLCSVGGDDGAYVPAN